jgi:hypothetical protein
MVHIWTEGWMVGEEIEVMELKRSGKLEIRTIGAMIRIYCRHHHGKDLCEECDKLLSYCLARIEKCIFGIDKPACNNCMIHCYAPKMREKVKKVMRFSGPKMIWKHPYLAIVHLIKENKLNQQLENSINQ